MSVDSASGPISRKVLKSLRGFAKSKVLDLAGVREGKKLAEDLQQATMDRIAETGAQFPAHAFYIYAQNMMADISDMLTQMPGTEPFVEPVEAAEEEYMPSWPPMSPISKSCFVCWSSFDLPIGKRRETVGTLVLDVVKEYGMHAEMIRLLRTLQDSRMGVYRALEHKKGRVRLRDLAGGEPFTAETPSGYQMKQSGELWLTRVLPPPIPVADHVVFTSPYVLVHPPVAAWLDYLDRAAALAPGAPREQALAEHFKWGPNPRYWLEFIFEGYVNHESGAIFLMGMPDKPDTRPHSPSFRGHP